MCTPRSLRQGEKKNGKEENHIGCGGKKLGEGKNVQVGGRGWSTIGKRVKKIGAKKKKKPTSRAWESWGGKESWQW